MSYQNPYVGLLFEDDRLFVRLEVKPGLIVQQEFDAQVFSYRLPSGAEWHYNISLALGLSRQHPVYVHALPTLSEHRALADSVDEAYCLTTDLAQPVLFAPAPWIPMLEQEGLDQYAILIDGHHRVRKALLTGVRILPCRYLVTPEAQACLICTLTEAEAAAGIQTLWTPGRMEEIQAALKGEETVG